MIHQGRISRRGFLGNATLLGGGLVLADYSASDLIVLDRNREGE